jgi:hypothetical protein
MAELTIEPTATGEQSPESPELIQLRKQVAELTAKSTTRKGRIAELEATIATLQGQLKESASALESANVTAPVKAMCASLSKHSLFEEVFNREFSVQMIGGKLALRAQTGEPITTDDGTEVPFEREAILKHLFNSKDEQRRNLYNAICIASFASGANSADTTSQRTPTSPKPTHSFGLR